MENVSRDKKRKSLSNGINGDDVYDVAPMCPSARLTLALEGTFGFCVLYLLRIHFSIALVCMTGSGADTHLLLTLNNDTQNASFLPTTLSSLSLSSSIEPSTSFVNDCGSDDAFSSGSSDKEGEFDWSKRLRGIMLSAFFWGYIVTQIPSGWLTSRWGSKIVITVGMLVSNVANVLIPVAARINPYLVVVLRFVTGLGHGVMFPSMHALWGRWAPPLERSRLISFTYAGTMIGTVTSLSLAGFICTIDFDNGWPLIFYIYGAVSFVWWFLWIGLVYNSPATHPRISQLERQYIEKSIGPSAFAKKFPVPWKSIFTSPPVWAIMVAHTCNNWGSYTVLTCVPAYMKEVLNFDIKANGVLVSMPYVFMYVLTLFAGQLGDFLLERKIFIITTVRKLFQIISFGIPAVFIVAVGFVDCAHRYLAVVFLSVALGCTAFGRCAYSINHVDIAPRFAGVLFGLTNTAATLPGMVSPYIAAAITPNGTAAEWRVVFFICGALYLFGLVVYVIFGSGVEQRWAKIESVAITKEVTSDEMELDITGQAKETLMQRSIKL